jgi:hypothetical protein
LFNFKVVEKVDNQGAQLPYLPKSNAFAQGVIEHKPIKKKS